MTRDDAQVVIFTRDVDELLQEIPVQVWDTVACAGIFIGIGLSLGGRRSANAILFMLSCLLGGLFGAYIMAVTNQHIEPRLWLSLVTVSALLSAFLVNRFVGLVELIVFLGLGVMLAGIVNQYLMAYLRPEDDPWIARSALVFCILASAILAWRAFEFALSLTMCIGGGFLVFLSVSWLTRSAISPAGMWANPELLVQCEELKCWTPLIAGTTVAWAGFAEKIGIIPCSGRSRSDRDEERPLLG